MRVLNFKATAANTSDRCTIAQPTQELLLRISEQLDPALIPTIEGASINPQLALLSALSEVIFTSINSKSGAELPSMPNIKLGALGYFAQHGEGAIQQYIETRSDGNKYGVTEVTILLAPALAVRLSAEESLEFSIQNCIPNCTYELYAQPAKAQGTNILQYANKSVNEGQTEASFGASNLSGLILPDSEALVEVVAQLANGQTEKRTPIEIAAKNAKENDVVAVRYGKLVPSKCSGYLWFDLTDAVTVQVKTTGAVYQFVTVQVTARG